MIDTLELSIPFDSSLVEVREDGRYAFLGVDFKELEINLGARQVFWNDEDELRTGTLYHPYESLPTSFSGMACKVHFDGFFFPHVTIKGSVAKILQGHNVFGTERLEPCVIEMLYWLAEAYPSLYGMLAVQCAEVVRIDITYMSQVKKQEHIKLAIDFLSRVHNGQTKPTADKKYETTAYWGGKSSRLIRLKCYGKYEEYMAQLNDNLKLASQGNTKALAVVKAMSDPRVQEIAQNSLRWEATFLKRYLERNDLPTNVWELIKRQKHEPDVFKKMWSKGFSKIKQALQGQEMKVVNDDEVLKRLKAQFYSVTASGRVSYRKAINLFDFYRALKFDGYDQIKASGRYSRSRFHELVADLASVGFSKAFLQNLYKGKDDTTIIPMIELITIDFNNQVPSWWVEPVPTPFKLASNDDMVNVA